MKKLSLILLVLVFTFSFLLANQIQGKIDFIRGSGAVIQPDSQRRVRELKVGDIVYEGEVIKADKDSYVDIEIAGSYFRIGQLSVVKLEELRERPQDARRRFGIAGQRGKSPVDVNLNVQNGSVLSKVDPSETRSTFKVSTPVAVCGVRGTFFETSHGGQTNVRVISGVVNVSPSNAPHLSVNVLPGQTTTLAATHFTDPPRPMSQSELNNLENFADGVSSSSDEPTTDVDMTEAPDAPDAETPSDVAVSDAPDDDAPVAEAPVSEAPDDAPVADAPVSEPVAAPEPVVSAPVETPTPVQTVNSGNVTNIITNTTVTGSVNNPTTVPDTVQDAIRRINVRVNIIY